MNPDGCLAHWIVNTRGIHAIIGSSWHKLTSGVLKPMLQCSFLETGPADMESRLEVLIWKPYQEFPTGAGHVHPQTLYEPKKWSKLAKLGFYGLFGHFTHDYGESLSKKDPYALIIFGYACVVLKFGEPGYWIDGCPEKLMRQIYEHLNTSLTIWLHWPMSELGLAW